QLHQSSLLNCTSFHYNPPLCLLALPVPPCNLSLLRTSSLMLSVLFQLLAGSTLHIYGGLSLQPCGGVRATDYIFAGKTVTGFWLNAYMNVRRQLSRLFDLLSCSCFRCEMLTWMDLLRAEQVAAWQEGAAEQGSPRIVILMLISFSVRFFPSNSF